MKSNLMMMKRIRQIKCVESHIQFFIVILVVVIEKHTVVGFSMGCCRKMQTVLQCSYGNLSFLVAKIYFSILLNGINSALMFYWIKEEKKNKKLIVFLQRLMLMRDEDDSHRFGN